VPDDDDKDIASSDNLMTAIRTILIADLVMSLDNVLGVAAAAETAPGEAKLVLVILGLAISIPIVIFGSTIVLHLMERFPFIITFGAALLGWIAGEMLVTDPVVAQWVLEHAAWLHSYYVAAIAGAAVVVAIGTVMARRKPATEGELP
jgi:predicted tellurium resistance membrane protein TerC